MTHKDQDIDFIEIYKILWSGKLIVFLGLVISILTGFFTINFIEKEFESKILITTNNFVSQYNATKISFNDKTIVSDFEDLYYSEIFFLNWKAENDINFNYEDFKPIKVINDITFSNKNNKSLIELKYDITTSKDLFGPITIIIKSNDKNLIGDFYKYLNHINDQLTKNYTNVLKNEIIFIEDLVENFKDSEERLNLDSYILKKITSEKLLKNSILRITPPSIPVKTAPVYSRIFLILLLFGGVSSIFIVFLRDYINKTK